MRDKFNKFMQERYGVDELSRFTMGAALVLIILTMFIAKYSTELSAVLLIFSGLQRSYMHIYVFFPEIFSSVMPKTRNSFR